MQKLFCCLSTVRTREIGKKILWQSVSVTPCFRIWFWKETGIKIGVERTNPNFFLQYKYNRKTRIGKTINSKNLFEQLANFRHFRKSKYGLGLIVFWISCSEGKINETAPWFLPSTIFCRNTVSFDYCFRNHISLALKYEIIFDP